MNMLMRMLIIKFALGKFQNKFPLYSAVNKSYLA